MLFVQELSDLPHVSPRHKLVFKADIYVAEYKLRDFVSLVLLVQLLSHVSLLISSIHLYNLLDTYWLVVLQIVKITDFLDQRNLISLNFQDLGGYSQNNLSVVVFKDHEDYADWIGKRVIEILIEDLLAEQEF